MTQKLSTDNKKNVIVVTMPTKAFIQVKINVPDFILTTQKFYMSKNAKELGKLNSYKVYKEAVVNCLRV